MTPETMPPSIKAWLSTKRFISDDDYCLYLSRSTTTDVRRPANLESGGVVSSEAVTRSGN